MRVVAVGAALLGRHPLRNRGHEPVQLILAQVAQHLQALTAAGINRLLQDVVPMGISTRIDTSQRTVHYAGEAPGMLRYDHLVIACGQAANLAIIKGMERHALPLKTLGDSLYLRNRAIERLERAELETDPEKLKGAILPPPADNVRFDDNEITDPTVELITVETLCVAFADASESRMCNPRGPVTSAEA